MLRIIGAVLVAGGAGAVGLMAVWRMGERVRALSGFIHALDLMESEIYYKLTALPELMKTLAASTPMPAGSLFAYCVTQLERLGDMPFSAIWTKAVIRFGSDSKPGLLRPRERDTLAELGAVLGRYDAEGQARAISYARRRFEAFLSGAEAERIRQGKVYGALGVVCGIATVIILI